jgi:hypothetical protein
MSRNLTPHEITARFFQEEILNTLGVFPISPKVLDSIAESILAILLYV